MSQVSAGYTLFTIYLSIHGITWWAAIIFRHFGWFCGQSSVTVRSRQVSIIVSNDPNQLALRLSFSCSTPQKTAGFIYKGDFNDLFEMHVSSDIIYCSISEQTSLVGLLNYEVFLLWSFASEREIQFLFYSTYLHMYACTRCWDMCAHNFNVWYCVNVW